MPRLTGQMLADVVLDAYIAMIPKTCGDATPLGQRPLSVLPVVCRIRVSARMGQLEGWFESWVLALDIEEVRTGAADSDVHLLVADVIKSFDTVDWEILDRVLSRSWVAGLVPQCSLQIPCSCSLTV